MPTYTMEVNGVINSSAFDSTGFFGSAPPSPSNPNPTEVSLQGDQVWLTITVNLFGSLRNESSSGQSQSALDTSTASLQSISLKVQGASGSGSLGWTVESPYSDQMLLSAIATTPPDYEASASGSGYFPQTNAVTNVTSTLSGEVEESIRSNSVKFFSTPANLGNSFSAPSSTTYGGSIFVGLPGPNGGFISISSAQVTGASLTTTAPPPTNTSLKKTLGALVPIMKIASLAFDYGAKLAGKNTAVVNTLNGLTALASAAETAFDYLSKNDPPDSNWQTIQTPVTPPVDTTGLPASVASGMKALAQLVGLSDAMETTYNRLASASAAGNGYWEQQQLAAFQSYETQAATAASAYSQALPAIASYTNSALAGTTVTAADISAYQAQIAANGLPPDLAATATALGFDASAQQAMATLLTSADPNQAAALIVNGYTDPSTVSAFNDLASNLAAGTITISGTPQEGQTLTASTTVSNSTFQWQRSTDGGKTWQDIASATASTYQVAEADEGDQLRVSVTSGGTTTPSDPTAAVIDIAPTLSVSVSGTAQEGQVLTAQASANDADATVAYQWQRSSDGSTWSNIVGAIGSAYTPGPSDDGNELRVVAASSDPDGSSTTANSTATAAVPYPNPLIVLPNEVVRTQPGGSTTVNVQSGGTNFITSLGSDIVNAGTGIDVVFAAGPSIIANGGSGQLIFVGGSGSDTVHGGSGTSIIYGGTGEGDFSGGNAGNNILVAAVGNTTLRGGGNGDALFGSPTGNGNLLQAGPGSEIMVEGGGATSIQGTGGTYVAFAGTGPDTYLVNAGLGGNDLIVGFKVGTDKLALNGFDLGQALASAATGDWGTTLNLNDGTQVVLFGVHNLGASDFV